MAWGISPYKHEVVPLEDYNSDFYLTLIYHAIESLGWHIGYFNHDGIIAYTNISWASYSEEISIRIKDNNAIIKSECVGYQAFFTDYGKNQKNLDLLFSEIKYIHFHLQNNLQESTQDLMNSVPEKQFLSLDDPPMVGKETLRGFFSVFVPKKAYTVTPILVIVNIAIFLVSFFSMAILVNLAFRSAQSGNVDVVDKLKSIYLFMGFSDRAQVLNGQVWRLLTNTFLHFSFLHILGNMIALIYIGSLIEPKIGRLNFISLYLCTGIISSMVSVIWREDGISAGASGAIFGLFGILLALCSTNFYERSARKALLISTAIFLILNITPIGKGVDHAAHFGGLITGYVFGLIAYASLKSENQLLKTWAAPVASLLIMAIFVSAGIKLTPNYQLKKYNDLISKTDVMTDDFNNYFYRETGLNDQQMRDTIEQKALPELTKFGNIGTIMSKLVLPAKKKKDAAFRSKLITLECHLYKLIYLEYKYNDHEKYRPAIVLTTDTINKVREDWGTLYTE